MKPVRRVVVVDEGDRSVAIADGPSPDVRRDPARPGHALHRIWVTDRTPVRLKGVRESLDRLPHVLVPPAGGSLCRVVRFPPETPGRLRPEHARDWYAALGAPEAWTGAQAPHPYMHRTRTLEFALVVEGEIVLVLDTEEVLLKAGDTVVQRGTNHAWSNRSGATCTVAFSTHDAL